MKKCPSCNDYALYDDEITTCPLCGATLVTYRRTVVHRATGSVVKPVSSNATVNRSGTGIHSRLLSAQNRVLRQEKVFDIFTEERLQR